MTVTWDPEQYVRYAGERSRPFHDLLAQVDVPAPAHVVDLGCGDGSLTGTLLDRWPAAVVQGVDSSAAMIEAAHAVEMKGQLEFCLGRIEEWDPAVPVDVLVSNAALQWVPGHLDLLGRLAAGVRPGGVLAFQVPANFDAPSHLLIDQLCAEERWRARLAGASLVRPSSHEPEEYLAALLGLGLRPRVWETTYLQILQGERAVLEWLKGTALRPVLSALGPRDQAAFLSELGDLLDVAYPPGPQGTVLPYRRVFVVASVPGDGAGGSGSGGAGAGGPAVTGLDHVQLAIPPGGEAAARAFYVGLLGLAERPKPPALAPRGGCWFKGAGAEVHVGIAPDPPLPAAKAHLALVIAGLDALAERLAGAGRPVTWDDGLAPRRRFYTEDPFGNRLELMAPPAPRR